MSTNSWRGASVVDARVHPSSTIARSAAISHICRPGLREGIDRRARPRRCMPTCASCAATACSVVTSQRAPRTARARRSCRASRAERMRSRCSTERSMPKIPTIRGTSRDVAILELLYGAGLAGQRVLRPRRRRRRPAPRRVTVLGKGSRFAGSPSANRPAAPCPSISGTPVRRCSRDRTAAAVRQRPGSSHDAPGRPAGARPPSAGRRADTASALPAARVRDAPAGGRRRSASRPGAARARRCRDDAGLHSCNS